MKPWHGRIQQHIQEWSNQLGNHKWWPKYVYHFTDVNNAANILKDGILYSRVEAANRGRMIVDNASPIVMAQTRQQHRLFVRLYFRPRTPTQFCNEGIRPVAQRVLGGAHCPIPVYFCFDALSILSLDNSEYSDGNMGSMRATHRGDRDFFLQIPFAQVFHYGRFPPDEHDEIIFRRNAEVLIPNKLPLEPDLKFIACRSVAERQTLMHLLDWPTEEKWQNKIKMGEQGFFERKWTYLEEVVYADNYITFRFNPDTQTPGPFQLRSEYQENGSDKVGRLEKQVECLDNIFRIRKPPNAKSGTVKLYLDDCLAYSDNIIFEDIPF
jgi:hypothetical protein